MIIAGEKRRILVVLFSPAPVAAGLYHVGPGGDLVAERRWSAGKRPRWVKSASRARFTVAVDAALPTLAEACDDLSRTPALFERLGPGISVCPGRGVGVAFRTKAAEDILALAFADGILADATTSAAAVELAELVSGPVGGDGARLSFAGGAALLSARVSGRILLRRFVLPGDTESLNATLNGLPPMRLRIAGPRAPGTENLVIPPHLRVEELPPGTGSREGELVESAARLLLSGRGPALHEGPRRSAACLAARLLPNVAATLVLLSLALLPALYSARTSLNGASSQRATEEKRLAEAKSRSVENAALCERLTRAVEANARAADDAAATNALLARLLDVENASAGEKKLELDRLTIGESGREIELSGSFPHGSDALFRKFTARLSALRLRPSREAALRDDGKLVRFTLALEEKR